ASSHAGGGVDPRVPRRMWRAILLATLLLTSAFWALLIGAVSVASTRSGGVAAPGLWIVFGLMLVPFVFVVLPFASRPPAAAGGGRSGDGVAPADRHPHLGARRRRRHRLRRGDRRGRHRGPSHRRRSAGEGQAPPRA